MEDRRTASERYQAAVAYFREAVRREPASAEAHYYLGRAFWQLDRRTEAVEAWKETLRLEPDHTRARDCLTQAGIQTEQASSRRRRVSGAPPNTVRRPSLKQRIHQETDGFNFQTLLEGVSLSPETEETSAPPSQHAPAKEVPRIAVAGTPITPGPTPEKPPAPLRAASEHRAPAPAAKPEPEKHAEAAAAPATAPSRTWIPAGVGLCLVLATSALVYSLNSHWGSTIAITPGRNQVTAPSTGSDPAPDPAPPSIPVANIASALASSVSAPTSPQTTAPAAQDRNVKAASAAANARPAKARLGIYIRGAVLRPGVYSLAAQSRLADAIITAGGTTRDADLTGIDLVAGLNDGQKILIPTHTSQAARPAIRQNTTPPVRAAATPTPGQSTVQTASDIERPLLAHKSSTPVGNNLLRNGDFSRGLAVWKQESGATPEALHADILADQTLPPGVPGKALRLHILSLGGLGSPLSFTQGEVNLVDGQPYTLTFWARADRIRPFSVSVTGDTADAHPVDLDRHLTLTTEWHKFTLVFTAVGITYSSSRVAFILGEARGTIDLAGITLRSGADLGLSSGT